MSKHDVAARVLDEVAALRGAARRVHSS